MFSCQVPLELTGDQGIYYNYRSVNDICSNMQMSDDTEEMIALLLLLINVIIECIGEYTLKVV